MEDLAITSMFGRMYANRKVLITGHTGFKGSWLVLWLSRMGAEVVGYALDPTTSPCHRDLLSVNYRSIIQDIRNPEHLQNVISDEQPEIIFHLAAQSLVRKSYADPIKTFSTNIMGTVNLLEACRQTNTCKAIILITSDKCYENREWVWGYREHDRLGGIDPYSASKGCAELIISSYRKSFFPPERYGQQHVTLVASARAGNVIGGGDWAEDRLIPDIMKAASQHVPVVLRSPNATRPWQHVLEPLSGYLLLGQRLLEGNAAYADAWNFGPAEESAITVEALVQKLQAWWGEVNYHVAHDLHEPHESGVLALNCAKVRQKLGWRTVWDIDETLEKTSDWYRHFYERQEVLSDLQLRQYIQAARQKNMLWTIA